MTTQHEREIADLCAMHENEKRVILEKFELAFKNYKVEYDLLQTQLQICKENENFLMVALEEGARNLMGACNLPQKMIDDMINKHKSRKSLGHCEYFHDMCGIFTNTINFVRSYSRKRKAINELEL